MENSRWINRVTKIEDYGLKIKSKKKSSKLIWDTVNDLPCFICPYIKKCNYGQKHYNPKECEWLTEWLISNITTTEKFTKNPFHPDYTSKKAKKADTIHPKKP